MKGGMRRTKIGWVVGLCILVILVAAVLRARQTSRQDDSRAFDAIQDAARDAKDAHEREMEAKREAAGRPAP